MTGHGSPDYWRQVADDKVRRWVKRWLPSLQDGRKLGEVESFAYLTKDIGTDRTRVLARTLKGKRVLVLGPPALLHHLETAFEECGVDVRTESIFREPKIAHAEVLVIEVTIGEHTKVFSRLQRLARQFDGPVITMGHFLFEDPHKVPKEASAALRIHGRAPVPVVWYPPLENDLRKGFEKLGLT